MTEKEIQRIVEEVVRRIFSLDEKKKVLVLTGMLSRKESISRYLQNTVEFRGEEEFLLNPKEQITASEKGEVSSMVENCRALFIDGLTLKQTVEISELRPSNPASEFAVEALRIGKPVVVVSEQIDAKNGTAAFSEQIDMLKDKLTAYGITFVSVQDLEGNPSAAEGREASVFHSIRKRLDQRVIAKQDIKDMYKGYLEIREDAVLTTTAKELLDRREIEIIRYRI